MVGYVPTVLQEELWVELQEEPLSSPSGMELNSGVDLRPCAPLWGLKAEALDVSGNPGPN